MCGDILSVFWRRGVCSGECLLLRRQESHVFFLLTFSLLFDQPLFVSCREISVPVTQDKVMSIRILAVYSLPTHRQLILLTSQSKTSNKPTKTRNSANSAPAALFNVGETFHHFPQQQQARFIPSGTKPSQETPRQLFVHECEQFAKQERGKGPCTLTLRASQCFVYRELTGRVIIVIVCVTDVGYGIGRTGRYRLNLSELG